MRNSLLSSDPVIMRWAGLSSIRLPESPAYAVWVSKIMYCGACASTRPRMRYV